MNSNEQFRELSRSYDGFKQLITDLTVFCNQLVKDISETNIKIDLAKLEIPDLDYSEMELCYEGIEKITLKNSNLGWTMTGEIDIDIYLNDELLDFNEEQVNDYFLDYYESNHNRHYLSEKAKILEMINNKWTQVINDCFQLYEQGRYQVIVPLLVTIVEGEISELAETDLYSGKLFTKWKTQIEDKDERYLAIIAYSLYEYLSSKLFGYKLFAEERGSGLNRNWILHGRDNPEYWTKVDALKLINVIASIQFIKE